jgi:hypothetical protein
MSSDQRIVEELFPWPPDGEAGLRSPTVTIVVSGTISETSSPADETPRSIQAKPSRKRTVTAVTTLLLATAFTLASVPATASTNNHILSVLASSKLGPTCPTVPGVCPP